MIEDRAYEENSYEEWLVLFEFISYLFSSYYLLVGKKSMGKNVVDDV